MSLEIWPYSGINPPCCEILGCPFIGGFVLALLKKWTQFGLKLMVTLENHSPDFSPCQDLVLGWGQLVWASYMWYLHQYTEPFPVSCRCRLRIFTASHRGLQFTLLQFSSGNSLYCSSIKLWEGISDPLLDTDYRKKRGYKIKGKVPAETFDTMMDWRDSQWEQIAFLSDNCLVFL